MGATVMSVHRIIEDFQTDEARLYEEYPPRWDRLIEKIHESRTIDHFRMFIREVYGFNSGIRLSSKDIPGRVPSGMSISHAALFIDRPILWVRDFNAHEFVVHLIRWGLIPDEELERLFGDSKMLKRYPENLKRLDISKIEDIIDIAFEMYRRSHKKLGLVIAATGRPERYRDKPEVVAFLKKVSEVQGGVPFGGIRNEFIATKLAEDEYRNLFEEGLRRFDGDYYAAFRYAKIFALSKVPPFKRSVSAVLDSVSNNKAALKEAYMTIYSSVYGSLMGVHPILGGKELHPDETSSFEFYSNVGASAIGPAGIFMKKRLELPPLRIDDVIDYGKSIRRIYKKFYLGWKGDFLDFDTVLPELKEEIQTEVENLKDKIDLPSLVSNSLSAVGLVFQFFSHSNVGLFDMITTTLSALYSVFVYYRFLKTHRKMKRFQELLDEILGRYPPVSVHCLIVDPGLK